MTYLQFKYYLNNDDLASISYRTFNKEEKDEYPTVSICFTGYYGNIFNESHDVFNSINVTRESYHDYLSGKMDYHPDQFSTIQFDYVALDIADKQQKLVIDSLESISGLGSIGGQEVLLKSIHMLPSFRAVSYTHLTLPTILRV